MEQESTGKNKLRRAVVYLILLAAIIGLVFFVVKKLSKKEEPPKEEVKAQTFMLQQQSTTDEMEFFGNLEANKESGLAAKTSGRVAMLKVDRGDQVKKGQLLAYLHPDQNAIDLANNIRNFNNFESYRDEDESYWDKQVSIARRAVDVAKEEDDYAKKYEPNKEEITEDKVELAEAELRSAKRERDAQDEYLNFQSGDLNGAVDISSQNVTDTKIFAPFSGVISDKFLEEGTVVSAGETILSVAEISSYKVVIEVPDTVMDSVSLGLKARVVLDGFPGEQTATVTLIRPKADPSAKKIEVEVTLDSVPQDVKLNAFARVYLTFPQRNTFFVPKEFVLSGYDGPFVVLDNGTEQSVQRGKENDGQTEISFAGIADGIIIKRK